MVLAAAVPSLLLSPQGLGPSSVVLTTLPGAAQPILADSLPSANISVLLEPGELGVGNKDSTLLSGSRLTPRVAGGQYS